MTAFDLATLDIVEPRALRAQRLSARRVDASCASTRRSSGTSAPNVDPFWAITKHADIIELGKQPELFLNAPRLAVFTQRPAAAARGDGRATC